MILFDETNAAGWSHASGLARVIRRLKAELGDAARGVSWPWTALKAGPGDWILTAELFSEHERPGLADFLGKRPCRLAAIYHDAIPIKLPDITWPASVERHPSYMKLLARFDHVWAVSEASRMELVGFWKWQGIASPPPVEVLALGADMQGIPRATFDTVKARQGTPRIVSVGILEPRKNQTVILEACESLRKEGLEMELHLVGRLNPHFGDPIANRLAELMARWPGLRYHRKMEDAALVDLIRGARTTAFASIAEGCGLPLLESLWLGVPCACSDIAPLLENAAGGGCAVVRGNDLAGWKDCLRRMLRDDEFHDTLVAEALKRPLPTWAAAAGTLREALR
jgi:glycosyltransferase involved in cell wall biosynthesis